MTTTTTETAQLRAASSGLNTDALRWPLTEWVLYVMYGDATNSAYSEHPASYTLREV